MVCYHEKDIATVRLSAYLRTIWYYTFSYLSLLDRELQGN